MRTGGIFLLLTLLVAVGSHQGLLAAHTRTEAQDQPQDERRQPSAPPRTQADRLTSADGESRLQEGTRSRGLLGGAGHSWPHGWPGWGKTETALDFAAFHPQMGWFVSRHLELYGEGTLLVYPRPRPAISGGLLGLAGRYHFRDRGPWVPYFTLGGGLVWTSVDVPEVDRVFNFQVVYGLGLRQNRPRGPGFIIELRNHHISNAGTAGENLGINAATVLMGVEWILR